MQPYGESEIDTSPSTLPPPPAPTAAAPTPAPVAPTVSYTAGEVKDVLIPRARAERIAIETEFWNLFNATPGAKISGGEVVTMKEGRGKTPLADGTFVNDRVEVPDTRLSELYARLQQAKGEESRLEANLKDGVYGIANTVSSALSREGGKASEIKRRFTEFMDGAKAVYGLQDAEQAYGMEAQQANAEGAAAMRKGLLAPGARTVWNEQRPSPLYSMMARDRMPADAPPGPYNPALGLGLEGEGEDVETYGDRYGIQDYSGIIGGYAEGTTLITGGTPGPGSFDSLDGPEVDPEIAWMIGMPDIPFDPDFEPVPIPVSWSKGKGGV